VGDSNEVDGMLGLGRDALLKESTALLALHAQLREPISVLGQLSRLLRRLQQRLVIPDAHKRVAHIFLENVFLWLVNRDESLVVRHRLVNCRGAHWNAWFSVVYRDAHLKVALSIVQGLVP